MATGVCPYAFLNILPKASGTEAKAILEPMLKKLFIAFLLGLKR